MSFTLCTSGAAVAKAGLHANTNVTTSGAIMNKFSEEAEGRIEAETRRSWVTNYAGLPAGVKGVLSDVSSSMIGMNVIAWDNTGYLTREADTLMNHNDDRVLKGLAVLKDFKSNSIQSP